MDKETGCSCRITFTNETDKAGIGNNIPCLSQLGDLELSSLWDTMTKFKMNFIQDIITTYYLLLNYL